MSGSDRYLVDTNVFISLLEGSRKAAGVLEGKLLYISFITEIELLGVPGISSKQLAIVNEALLGVVKIGLPEAISQRTIAIKQLRKVKIPDAIIAATSLEMNIPLLTADKTLANIEGVSSILFEE